jgi:dTMP kinase
MKRWIVVDGLDGSGKNTVAGWIREHYEDHGSRVVVRVHPSERWAGRMARKALQSKGLLMYLISTMFFVLDVLLSVTRLRRDLRENDVVIFVRYMMATAYLPRRYARAGYHLFSKVLPVPRRLLLVDVTPEVALRRIACREDREEMFENLAALNECREKLLMLSNGWAVLDNNDDPPESRRQLYILLEDWDRQWGG